jgi:hypothetical protein
MKKLLITLTTWILLIATAWPGFAQETRYTAEQLDQMLQGVALYPDPLLAQMLPASAYPSELQEAAAFIEENGSDADIDAQSWDDSVKAVARYPDVLQQMAQDTEWVAALGEAFAHQQADVAASVQRLRRTAYDNGHLRTGSEQRVADDRGYITIVPANQDELYVPQYEPEAVYSSGYVSQPSILFSMAYTTGPWLSYGWDWLGTSCFRYPAGTYWGRGGNLYGRVGYCGVNYIQTIYNPGNRCAWQVNRQRYASCRPRGRSAYYTPTYRNGQAWNNNLYSQNGYRGARSWNNNVYSQGGRTWNNGAWHNGSARWTSGGSTRRWNNGARGWNSGTRSWNQTPQTYPSGRRRSGISNPQTTGTWNGSPGVRSWTGSSDARSWNRDSGRRSWNSGRSRSGVSTPSYSPGMRSWSGNSTRSSSRSWNTGGRTRSGGFSNPGTWNGSPGVRSWNGNNGARSWSNGGSSRRSRRSR